MADKIVRVQQEQDIFSRLGISPADFNSACEANYKLFKEYWDESEQHGIQSFERLSSYQRLKRAGWIGAIPAELRQHFRKRLFNNGVTSNVDDVLCRFFACVLYRYQVKGFFNGRFRDNEGQTIPPLRMSFAPFPPAQSGNMYEGRINYRLLEKSHLSSYRVPPWACCGILKTSRNASPHILLLSMHAFEDQVNNFCVNQCVISSTDGTHNFAVRLPLTLDSAVDVPSSFSSYALQ